MTLLLERAEKLATDALARARSRGMHVSIAVIDSSFFLKYGLRDEGAGPATMDIAFGKARAALGFGYSSRQIADALAANPMAGASVLASLPGPLVLLAGGVLVHDEAGCVIGAIAVSGSSPDNDEWAASGM